MSGIFKRTWNYRLNRIKLKYKRPTPETKTVNVLPFLPPLLSAGFVAPAAGVAAAAAGAAFPPFPPF